MTRTHDDERRLDADVESAKLAVSATHDTTPEVALELVRGLARSQGRDLHEYAAAIVAHGGRLDV